MTFPHLNLYTGTPGRNGLDIHLHCNKYIVIAVYCTTFVHVNHINIPTTITSY